MKNKIYNMSSALCSSLSVSLCLCGKQVSLNKSDQIPAKIFHRQRFLTSTLTPLTS